VTNHGHIIPKDVKLRGCHPAVKDKIHELLQVLSERDAKAEMLTYPVFYPYAQYFEGIFLKGKLAMTNAEKSLPICRSRR
jgi:hypothetical protein